MVSCTGWFGRIKRLVVGFDWPGYQQKQSVGNGEGAEARREAKGSEAHKEEQQKKTYEAPLNKAKQRENTPRIANQSEPWPNANFCPTPDGNIYFNIDG